MGDAPSGNRDPFNSMDPFHTFWGQNGAAFAIAAVIALATRAATGLIGVAVCCALLLIGLYGMFAPFLGLPLPEPRPETQFQWRIGFGVLAIIVVGGLFISSKPGSMLLAKLLPAAATAPPKPTPSAAVAAVTRSLNRRSPTPKPIWSPAPRRDVSNRAVPKSTRPPAPTPTAPSMPAAKPPLRPGLTAPVPAPLKASNKHNDISIKVEESGIARSDSVAEVTAAPAPPLWAPREQSATTVLGLIAQTPQASEPDGVWLSQIVLALPKGRYDGIPPMDSIDFPNTLAYLAEIHRVLILDRARRHYSYGTYVYQSDIRFRVVTPSPLASP